MLSLFDGISCGRLALDRSGIAVEAYAAFEIDRYARAISRYNYPDITQHGNVLEADFNEFLGFDMVIGGSPCTFWSIAKANREIDKNGTGWKLFMRFADAVRQIKPQFFLYENVASMPKSIREYISEELLCEPILINSSLVSAQQRKRLYWTNIKGVAQPQDKGILLKDILDSGITARDKSHCIDACYYKGGNHSSPNKQSGQRNMVYEPVILVDKAQTMPSKTYKDYAQPTVIQNEAGLFYAHPIGAALRTREDDTGRFKRLEVRNDGKSNSLTTVQTDSVICEPVRVGELGRGSQGYRIYSVKGKTICISAAGGGFGGQTGLYRIDLPDGDYIVRKLSPNEAERCQTLDDDYTAFGIDDTGKTVRISNTQRYKAIGNGWTVDVISHILKHIHT